MGFWRREDEGRAFHITCVFLVAQLIAYQIHDGLFSRSWRGLLLSSRHYQLMSSHCRDFGYSFIRRLAFPSPIHLQSSSLVCLSAHPFSRTDFGGLNLPSHTRIVPAPTMPSFVICLQSSSLPPFFGSKLSLFNTLHSRSQSFLLDLGCSWFLCRDLS